MGHAKAHFFCACHWGPVEGPKSQISLNFNYKVNFKDFKPNFVCLLTNEIYKTYQMRFSFSCQGHVPGWDLGVWGRGGGLNSEIQQNLIWSVRNNFFGPFYIMWPIHLQGLRVLRPTIEEEIHLQETLTLSHKMLLSTL